MTRLEIAVLASGCFWCTEPVFSQLKGVKKVSCGYTLQTHLTSKFPVALPATQKQSRLYSTAP